VSAKPALNEPANPVQVGARPYEMAGREEDRVPLVDFEDLSGWTVHCEKGADADLTRTREQQMWGRYVGKLTYSGKSDESKVILRPPAPIPIRGSFDCINMWIYGNTWEWAPDPGTPFVDVSVLVTDSAGQEQPIYLTRVRWKEWWLAHRKLDTPPESASFSGIEVKGISNAEARSIFLDSLCFYKETLKPLKFEPRPARNLALFPGQHQGLNGTGPGKLPFPTREETILPSNFTSGFKNSVRETSPGSYEFAYAARDCEVTYAYMPHTGGLGEITAYVDGRQVCVPMQGGGLELDDGSVREGRLVSSSLENGEVAAVFEFGHGADAVRAEYRLRIRQKSLVMDFICRGGKAAGLSLGEVREVEDPGLVLIPYLTFGGSNPRVLCFGSPDSPRFTSVWVDWYRSNGSALWSHEWAQPDAAKINGGVRYLKKTDGRRNDLYERVFLTVSPTFEETLPTIANPPTAHGKVVGECLWQESWGPQDYEKEHERSRMLRSYGIEKLIQCNHEITWRDGGESFTLRTNAAPKKGGNEGLRKYVAAQKSLGWLSGLYTNYTDYAPVNEHWDEDAAQLTPEGEWRPAWPRCYALKPSRAVECDAKLAPVIKRKFGSTSAYTDVHTAVAPWGYCDFDARVPGAGTFAATFYAYGELLLNDQKVYGPIFSEGTFQWLYAGLASGNYGLAYTSVDLSKEPLNVAFDLMKIHTLECDIGMPWTGGFFKESGWDSPEKIDESIDHFIAATMAYGHIGWLVEEQHGIQRTCRSYYMLQQLQKRYAMRAPALIEYADREGRRFNASKAIASGAVKDSRLHVRYDNRLHVYVNGSDDKWTIRGHDARPVQLPPWGWYAYHTGTKFLEFAALANGRRVDYVRSPDYEYLDGRGVHTLYGDLAARGSIAVRRAGGTTEIIDIYGNDEIGFRVKGRGTCVAYDADGKSLGPVEIRYAQDDMAWLKAEPKARRYVFKLAVPRLRGSSVSLSFPREIVVPGESLTAAVRFRPEESPVVRRACLGIEGTPPVEISEWSGLRARAGREYVATVPIRCPNTVLSGSKVWVKASVSTDAADPRSPESWFVLTAVPPFEIGLREIGEGRFEVDVAANLGGAPEPEVHASLKSGQAGLALRTDQGEPRVILIEPPSEPREASDTLVIRVSHRDFSAVKEFPVRAVVEYPTQWKVTGREGFVWGYAFRGRAETTGDVQTGASFSCAQIVSSGVPKYGIFSHPPYRGGVGYTYGITSPIAIPDQECELRTFIGIKDGGDVSDGVLFTMLALDDEGGERLLVKEHWAKREWKEVAADLSAFKGKTIRLKFIADVGPNDDSTADWASWGEPRVILKQPVMRIRVEP